MKKLDYETKFAHLGKPGSAFSRGFERRLQKFIKIVDLNGKRILDQGCGEGVWLDRFMEFILPENVFGFDVDKESIDIYQQNETKIPENNLKICPAEELDFADNMFDIIFSNEVLEHVEDDKKSVEEAWRVLDKGGKFIIFTPNRGWPFETHGMFLKGKYYWGNIPFLPWMPKSIRKKFAPHVRNYSNSELLELFDNSKWKVVHHSHVFPGFDGAVRRFGIFGKLLQKFFHTIEKTPLHFFGISHFLVVEKV